jgi:hypothetical protein
MLSGTIMEHGRKAGLRENQLPRLVVNTHAKSQYLDYQQALESSIAELKDEPEYNPSSSSKQEMVYRESGTQQATLANE